MFVRAEKGILGTILSGIPISQRHGEEVKEHVLVRVHEPDELIPNRFLDVPGRSALHVAHVHG